MKKFIRKVVFFFIFVLSIDICYGKLFDYLNGHAKGGDFKRMDDICMKDRHDILVLGSSRARHHYIPTIIEETTGLDCYNAGFDGNGVILSYGIVELLTKRYNPKLIIYDVEPSFDLIEYPLDNNCTRYLGNLKPYFRDSSVAQIFNKISSMELLKVQSGFYRYNSTCIQRLTGHFLKWDNNQIKGYEPLAGKINRNRVIAPDSSLVAMDSIKLYYMHLFISEVSKKGIPLVVVASPKFGASSDVVFDVVKRYCRESNVPFLNYYKSPNYVNRRDYFKEPMHLNNKGAEMFSKDIKKAINDMGLLKGIYKTTDYK